MTRRQAKKILRRDDALRRALGPNLFPRFKLALGHRERGRSKALAIRERDCHRDYERILGRWSPETAEQRRALNREAAESAKRMITRIQEMLETRLAKQKGGTRG